MYVVSVHNQDIFVGTKDQCCRYMKLKKAPNVLDGQYGRYHAERCYYDYYHRGKLVIRNKSINYISKQSGTPECVVRGWLNNSSNLEDYVCYYHRKDWNGQEKTIQDYKRILKEFNDYVTLRDND